MSMSNEIEQEEPALEEDYFYFITPTGTATDVDIRRRARRMFNTFYNIDQIVEHVLKVMPPHIKQVLVQVDFDQLHPMVIFLLMSMSSAYGINEEKYPYLVNDSIEDTFGLIMKRMKDSIIPDPKKYV